VKAKTELDSAMKVRLLMIAEIEVEDAESAVAEAQARLDAFREAVLPLDNYGISLYRTSLGDLEAHQLVAGYPGSNEG
jgi:hypothetical protein